MIRKETTSITTIAYRFYEYGVVISLFLIIILAYAVQVGGYHVGNETSWLIVQPFFFAAYYLIRQPELIHNATYGGIQDLRKFILRTTLVLPAAGLSGGWLWYTLDHNPSAALVVTGLLCFIWGYLLYHRALADGSIKKPAFAYWAAISVVDWSSLLVSLRNTGFSSIATLQLTFWSLGATSVTVLILWRQRKAFEWRPTRTDFSCVVICLLAIITWGWSGRADLTMAALALSMVAACLPLVVNAAQGRESALPLSPFALGGTTGLFSVSDWSWHAWQNWIIPVIGFVSFGGAFLCAVFRKAGGKDG